MNSPIEGQLVELSIAVPDAGPMQRAEAALRQANALAITSQEGLDVAAAELRAIKARAKELDDLRKSLVKPVDEARNRIQGLFKPALEFLDSAERLIKGKVLAYTTEQRRIADEAARKEQDRLRKLEAAKAARAETKGDVERAQDIRARAQDIYVPPPPPPRAAGISTRVLWRAELTDIKALCAAVAAGAAPTDLVQFDQAAGNRLAAALRDAQSYPGVRFVATESLAARA